MKFSSFQRIEFSKAYATAIELQLNYVNRSKTDDWVPNSKLESKDFR